MEIMHSFQRRVTWLAWQTSIIFLQIITLWPAISTKETDIAVEQAHRRINEEGAKSELELKCRTKAAQASISVCIMDASAHNWANLLTLPVTSALPLSW